MRFSGCAQLLPNRIPSELMMLPWRIQSTVSSCEDRNPVPNTCNCPTPPGGTVSCSNHQLAVCRIVDGQVRAECIDQPGQRSALAISNWILSAVTGQERTARQRLSH